EGRILENLKLTEELARYRVAQFFGLNHSQEDFQRSRLPTTERSKHPFGCQSIRLSGIEFSEGSVLAEFETPRRLQATICRNKSPQSLPAEYCAATLQSRGPKGDPRTRS